MNTKANASLLVRLWILATVFVAPVLMFDFQFTWLAVWVGLGALLGAWWFVRHRAEPDPTDPPRPI
jgi:hypothetical protein